MATAYATMPGSPAAAGEVKLEYGATQVIALKFTSGKSVEGRYGPRVMFTASDERRLWLDPEDASDLEHSLVDLGIQPGDPFTVTKIRHARGGGHSLRIARFSDAAEPATEM